MHNDRLQILALLGLAAVLFFVNTWGYDLWPADEPRFGEIPREMMQTGNYLVPHCNGEPYKEKPPLLFWTIVAASLPFGDVTEFSARAPSGVAALLTVLFTYLLAARLYGRRVAFWSALILMTMSFFWSEARSVRTDMLLTACMTGALLAFWRWHETRQARYLVALYAGLALGLLTKGPPALAFPLLLIFAFYWRRTPDRRRIHWMLGTLIAVVPVLAWFIAARMSLPPTSVAATHAGMGGELYQQIIGRLFLGVSKAQPPWYYLYNIPAGMLPWTLFLPWVLLWTWRHRREDDRAGQRAGRMRLLLAWTVPAFLFFSISIGKRGVYLLPIYPTLAILTARSVLDLADGSDARWRQSIAAVWGVALFLIAAGPLVLLATSYRDLWNYGSLPFLVCAIVFGSETLRRAFNTEYRTLHAGMAGHFAALAVLAATFFFPALDHYKGASDFCRPVRELALAKTDLRLYSLAFSREEYVFYSRHFHKDVFIDPLDVKIPNPIDPNRSATQQRRIRAAITRAVDDLPIVSLDRPTESEIAALRATVRDAIAKSKAEAEFAQAFETALTDAVAQFAQEFEQSTPAFAYVQEQDWKWLLPLFPHAETCAIIARDGVGKRSMLLLANQAGVHLATQRQ